MPTKTRKASEKFLTGEEVRIWRHSRKLTLAQLAEWLGLTGQAVSAYEARGATRTIALALSAIDRGAKPYKPTAEEIREYEADKPK